MTKPHWFLSQRFLLGCSTDPLCGCPFYRGGREKRKRQHFLGSGDKLFTSTSQTMELPTELPGRLFKLQGSLVLLDVSLDPRARGTNRPGCPGMGLPLARPGMAGGCWKRASRIWLELGLTHISKPDHSPSPFPGLGWPCLLTRSAEGATLPTQR